jgi:hypothetical protein
MHKDKLEIEKLQQELNQRKKKKPSNKIVKPDEEGRRDIQAESTLLGVDQIVQNHIERENANFSALSKLVGGHKKGEKFEPFISPFIEKQGSSHDKSSRDVSS